MLYLGALQDRWVCIMKNNSNINIKMIFTSEIRVTVLIDEKEVEKAVNAAHDIFGLAD